MSKGDKEEARRLEGEAHRLEQEAHRLEEVAHRLEDEAHKLEDRAHELEDRDRKHDGHDGHGGHGGHGGEGEHGGHGDEGGHGGPKTVEITAVVNGQPVEIEAGRDELLSAVRARALLETNNLAQPPENWEFKDEAGVALDTDKTVGELGFGKKVTLFLSLRAGVAGA